MTAPPIPLTLAANGRIVIPAPLRAALGLKEGARLVARVDDGVIVIEPIEAAIRRAQVRKSLRSDPGLGIGESAFSRSTATSISSVRTSPQRR